MFYVIPINFYKEPNRAVFIDAYASYAILDTNDCVVEFYTGRDLDQIATLVQMENYNMSHVLRSYYRVKDMISEKFLDSKLYFKKVKVPACFGLQYDHGYDIIYDDFRRVRLCYGSNGLFIFDSIKKEYAFRVMGIRVKEFFLRDCIYKHGYYIMRVSLVISNLSRFASMILFFDKDSNLCHIKSDFGAVTEGYLISPSLQARFDLAEVI